MRDVSPARISAVVPAYNVTGYIAHCVKSLLSCTDCSMEIIVVDDASTDATRSTIQEQFGNEPRVRYLRLEVNQGPSHARNLGMREATGEWLAFVDADDWCAPERFAELVRVARRFDADVVSDDNYLIEDGSSAAWATINQVSRWRHKPADAVTFEKFIQSRHIVKPLVRLSFIRSARLTFHEDFRHSEDFLFFCELLLAGARWHTTATAMYYYRIRSGSLTNTGEFARDSMRAVECLLGLEAVSRKALYRDLVADVLRECLREGTIRETRAAMLRLDFRKVGRALARDASLLLSIIRQEASLTRFRVRRKLHRLGFR